MTDVIIFHSVASARALVAGIPACARAGMLVRAINRRSAGAPVVLAIPGGRIEDSFCRSELARLCGEGGFEIVDRWDLPAGGAEGWMAGEALVAASADGEETWPASFAGPAAIEKFYASEGEAQLLRQLRQAGRRIIRATGKSADGVISRHINRRFSMCITALLLRFSWVRPGHATAVTGLIALAMVAALLTATQIGLIAGGVLFQLASMFDGVDGEIARATGRGSARGAMLDTLTDGLTNVGFIAGLAANLAYQGVDLALEAGLVGAASFGLGCVILAVKAFGRSETVTFDAVANWLKQQPGAWGRLLVAIGKRDFFALASMLLILASLAKGLLIILSASSAIWLVLVVTIWTRSTEMRRIA